MKKSWIFLIILFFFCGGMAIGFTYPFWFAKKNDIDTIILDENNDSTQIMKDFKRLTWKTDLIHPNVQTKNGNPIFFDPRVTIAITTKEYKYVESKWSSKLEIKSYLNLSKNQCSCIFYWKQNIKFNLTIIMSINNQEKFIKEQLKNIIEYTVGPFELILICEECADKTEVHILDFLNDLTNVNIATIIVLSIKKSICDNLGFKLASAPLILQLHTDMILLTHGYNLILQKPLTMYKDIFAVSSMNGNNNECFLMQNSPQGPILFDHEKLKQCSDNNNLMDDAFKKFGYRLANVNINWKKRNSKVVYYEIPYITLPTFRPLIFNPIIDKKDYIVWTTFSNTSTIYSQNTELALKMNDYLGFKFSETRHYNEFDVLPWLQKHLPLDAQKEPKRGYYYWGWKPFILQQTMLQVPGNSIILYTDSSMFLTNLNNFDTFVQQTKLDGYCFFKNFHSNLGYVKCEIYSDIHFEEHDEFNNAPMVDASCLLLKNTPEMQNFIQEWIQIICKPYFLSDQFSNTCVNDEHFIEHRHDQALLTLLLRKRKMNYNNNAEEFTYHHRIRSEEHHQEICTLHPLWADHPLLCEKFSKENHKK